MQMTIQEVLFILSSAIALPVIAVLTFSFFQGGLKSTEGARFLPVREADADWWSTEPAAGSSEDAEGGEDS